MLNIKVLLNYSGLLLCLDGHMNLALEQVEEIQNGQITNRFPSAFIRGNNGKQLII
jgi:small nuclear ribonucleoprotein (snRNP)-like protein